MLLPLQTQEVCDLTTEQWYTENTIYVWTDSAKKLIQLT